MFSFRLNKELQLYPACLCEETELFRFLFQNELNSNDMTHPSNDTILCSRISAHSRGLTPYAVAKSWVWDFLP